MPTLRFRSSLIFTLSCAATAVMIFISGGCGGSSGHDPSKPTIAVIPKGTAHEFWQTVHAGAVTAGRELGVNIAWQGPQTEIMRDIQLNIIENFIVQKVDGMALAPQDADAMLPSIKHVNASGIPLVLFDSDANTRDYVSFVATDNFKGGVEAAKKLGELLGGQGKVIIIANEPGSGSTMLREDGFKQTITNEFPGIQIVDMQYGKSDRATARNITEDLLTRYPDVDGVFASCEPMTFGAWQALRTRAETNPNLKKPKLVGFDTSEKLNEGLRNGEIDALIMQDPFRMGYLAVSTLVDHLNGKPVEHRIDTGVHVVTQANMDTPEMATLIHPDLSILQE